MTLRRAAQTTSIAVVTVGTLTLTAPAYAQTISGPPQTIHVSDCAVDDSCYSINSTTKITINKNITMRWTQYRNSFLSNICGGSENAGKTFSLSRTASGQIINQRFTDVQTWIDDGCGEYPPNQCALTLKYTFVHGKVLLDSHSVVCTPV